MLDIIIKKKSCSVFVCWPIWTLSVSATPCGGTLWTHLSFCLSVNVDIKCLNFNWLHLKKEKKKRSVESEIMHCKYDFKCIACFSGKFHPTVEACFPFLLTFSSALFCSKPCLQNCESRRRPALRFTHMPAYMPYLYKIIFNSKSSNVRTYSWFFLFVCFFGRG